MLFNSMHFLLFFPAVVLVYFLLPHRARWVWLLAASYYFYMCWNPKYVLLLAASTLATWLSGLLIARSTTPGRRRLWVALCFLLNLGILFTFKYFNFAFTTLNTLLLPLGFQLNHPTFDVLLPVGISFYTFQALSYTVDVYRGEVEPQKNLGKYALFVSFFPQLVAGPIERSTNLLYQFDEVHHYEGARVRQGLWLMLWGFFEKVIIADRLAILVDTVYNDHSAYGGAQLAVATLLFAVQIYCDFSGYSDIAIGAAQVMGFSLMDNFRQPYFATSIQDFWRRWHISLSTWFRDYLYIPLGGSRKGRLRGHLNVMLTFLVSGLWHGARWSFVAWGGLHGAYQVLGGLLRPARDKLYAALQLNRAPALLRLGQGLVTFVLVCFAWIFFRAPGIGAALDIVRRLFTRFDPATLLNGGLAGLGLDSAELAVAAVAMAVLLLGNLLQRRMVVRQALERRAAPLRWALAIGTVLCLLVFGVYGPQFNAAAFIYFQF